MGHAVVCTGFPHGGDRDVYSINGSFAPTAGSYWLVGLAAGWTRLMQGRIVNDVTIPTARNWTCAEVYPFFHASEVNGDVVGVFDHGTLDNAWSVKTVIIDASTPTATYKFQIYYNGVQVGPDGITTYNDEVWRQTMLTWLSGQIALEVDGTVEINVAYDQPIPDIGFGMGPAIGHSSTGNMRVRKYVQVRGDDGDERPDETTQLFAAVEPDSAGAQTHTAWTPNDASKWDDWNGGGSEDDGGSYAQAPLDTPDYETITIKSAPTLTLARSALMAHCRPGLSGAAAAKDLGDAVICDGTNDRRVDLGTKAADGYISSHAMFNKAPDGADFDQAALNALEVGMHGNGATGLHNLRESAVWSEFVQYGLRPGDPPALGVPTHAMNYRRRRIAA